MDVQCLRRFRRVLSAAVSVSAVALVLAKTRTLAGEAGSGPALVASAVFLVSLLMLVAVWRQEHAANEAAFAAREQQQLAALRVQLELARLEADKQQAVD